jgi:predicted RNA-binding protein (virulence factor B family)|tara:strand:+ start:1037 stop:1456 length:420 start_codon:yes stop_codon:yes gene_type:complete
MEIKECDQVNLTITKKTDLGFVVLINNSINGLLYENDIYEPVEVGMNKIGFIKKIRQDGKIDVSLQRQGFLNVIDKNCSIILNKLIKRNKIFLTDKSSPDDIISELNMSKKAFKAAIGVLYRKKKIKINMGYIKLNKKI